MKDVFVSYRRSDTSDVTGRIFDRLKLKFGEKRLFKDVDSILKGDDFRAAIGNAVGQCEVLLAVIGKDWLTVSDASGNRRIDDPNDYVHLEIAAALARHIPVIPVLVANSQMPKPSELPPALTELAYRNAAIVRSDPDFQHDIEKLCVDTATHLKVKGKIVTSITVIAKTVIPKSPDFGSSASPTPCSGEIGCGELGQGAMN